MAFVAKCLRLSLSSPLAPDRRTSIKGDEVMPRTRSFWIGLVQFAMFVGLIATLLFVVAMYADR